MSLCLDKEFEESLLFIRPNVEDDPWALRIRSEELSLWEAGILVKLLSADGGRYNSPSSSLLELSAADAPLTIPDVEGPVVLWPPGVTVTLEGPEELTEADTPVFEAVTIFEDDRKGNNESSSPWRTTSSRPGLRTSATGQDWLRVEKEDFVSIAWLIGCH